MSDCKTLNPLLFFKTAKNWYDDKLCCWESPTRNYNYFLTALTHTYNQECKQDKVFSDYVTQLFTDCLSGSSSSHTHTLGSYWSGNTDGSISPSGLTTHIGIGTSTPNEELTVVGTISATTNVSIGGDFIGVESICREFNSTSSIYGYNLNGAKVLWKEDGDIQVGNVTLDTDIIGTSINLQTATTINDNLTVTGITYLGKDLHIKDDQFIYFAAETDTDTRIRRNSNNLRIEATDDILLLPDDDLKIGVGGSQYAIFDGGTNSLSVGAADVPTARLTLKIGQQTTNFNDLSTVEGCSAHYLYADMVTAQESTMRLVFGETTTLEGGVNHTFVIFPTPTSLPNETYSADIVLGGYQIGANCAVEILRIDGSASRVGIKQQTPLYDLDVTGTFRATTNAVIGGDIDVDGVTNLDNTDIDGTFTMDGTAFDVNGTTTVAIDNSNTSNGITIGTATSAVPVSIGHTTSETTVNDNLTVTGDATIPTRKYELPSNTVGDFKGGDIYYYGNGSTVKGSIYYINGTNWTLADADLVASSTVLLAVALGTDPDVDGMLLRGFVTLLTEVEGTEAIGSVLYLSATDTGIATTTAPSGTGDVVRVVGYSLHATDNQIYFNPDPTWVELT